MKYLQNPEYILEKPSFELSNSLTFEIKLSEEFSVIVCGKTDTAIDWAERFLKAGYVTAIQFEEIPEKLLPYRLNLRYKSDDLSKGDSLCSPFFGAVATGDPELDQIMTMKLHRAKADYIMSETPSRYANIKFPEDSLKQNKIPSDVEVEEDDHIIKLGIFKDELNSYFIKRALKELNKNFPDFQFKIVELNEYDTNKYDLNYRTINHETFQELVNKSYDRSFNILMKNDIDLVLVDGKTIPQFYSPDVDFWPTLITRDLNDIIFIKPRSMKNKETFDWPDGQEVYVTNWKISDEIKTKCSWHNTINGTQNLPDINELDNSKNVEEIYEKNPNVIIAGSISDFFNLDFFSGDFFDKYKVYVEHPSITPTTLDGFSIGISRKDNPSKALKLLKIASQKINSDQTEIFMLENIYKNILYPYYDRFMDYCSNGVFCKYGDKYLFSGYAKEKHGFYIKSEQELRETLEEAAQDMFDFITKACIS